MTKTIESSIIIKASQDIIWEKLTNFQEYNSWNPQIRDIKGEFKIGGTIYFNVISQEKKMSVKATLKKMDRPRLICWQSGVRRVFHVSHEFILTQLSDDTVNLLQKETYSGLVLPFVERLNPELMKMTEYGFEKVNLKVKQDCELKSI